MRRGVDLTQIEAAHRKRTKAAALLIFILMPLTILAGMTLFGDRQYMLVSTMLLIYTMLPFYMVFEKRKPKAREIVLIAMMSALVVAIELFCNVTVPVRAGSALVIVAGISLGPEAGFLIGSLARFVLNFYIGQGPWTPWQMFSWGLLAFLAGLAFNKPTVEKLKSRSFQVVMGPVLCIAAGIIAAYICYLLFPGDNGTFFGWRLYLFGALGMLAGVMLQRKRLPVDDLTLTVFTFFAIFIIYGGLLNICAMTSSAGIPGAGGISWDTLKVIYISGVSYDFFHAGSAAVFNFFFGNMFITKLERIKLKYGIYR